MIKKISKLLVYVAFLVSLFSQVTNSVFAQELTDQINIYFFYTSTCPHCQEEKPFLGFLESEYDQVEVYSFEVTDPRNSELYEKVGEKLGFRYGPVPFTTMVDYSVLGYGNLESHGLPMQYKIEKCLHQEVCQDVLSGVLTQEELERGKKDFESIVKREQQSITELQKKYSDKPVDEINIELSEPLKTNGEIATNITVPFLGQIDAKKLSLPVLAISVGLLDGFNPCAMWTLLFLISLLLGMKDKMRMWFLGVTFIAVSAFVYFLFMTAWLNTFLFLGMVTWVRLGIGLLALGVGSYHLYDYCKYKGVCHVTSSSQRQKTFEKLKLITKNESLLMALGGIVLLAFAVNLVELMCSAGFPAIFTHVLSMSDLPIWQYYAYILLYLLMFMIDDIVVFGLAMITLQSSLVGESYAKYSKIIGGVLMFLIGTILIFKPELLMFG